MNLNKVNESEIDNSLDKSFNEFCKKIKCASKTRKCNFTGRRGNFINSINFRVYRLNCVLTNFMSMNFK